MPPRLYVLAAPMPTGDRSEALWQALSDALCSPGVRGDSHRSYLDALRTRNPAVTQSRLFALSLLLPLLEEAGIDPGAVSLSRAPSGRPMLVQTDGGGAVDFNLSHAARHAACALWVGEGQVGVDMEEPVPVARVEKLAARYFSDGERAMLRTWATHEGLSSAFSCLWTRKEALCKQSLIKQSSSRQDAGGGLLSHDASVVPPGLCLHTQVLEGTGTALSVCYPDEQGVEIVVRIV